MPHMANRSFSTIEACKLSGVTFRQADYWARCGFLAPSIMEANGSGTQRRYSEEDVRLLAVARQMLDAGLTLQMVRQAIPDLRVGAGLLDELWLVIVDGRVAIVLDPEPTVSALEPGQVAHVLRPEPLRSLTVTH